MAQPFYLALNMAGTVSAGAYTAGVVDYLIEAMDAWSAERERQKAQFGEDYERWTIPPHELQLAVMTGASGGGITAALTAAALSQAFQPVRDQTPAASTKLNTLFRSWVTDIDLRPLLGHTDLDADPDNVVSLLDSTIIRQIAGKALAISDPLAQVRPWVRDPLRVTLTLTNLAGVPYFIEPPTDARGATSALYYADRREFAVSWTAPASGDETLNLAARGGQEWRVLADTAVATGAFPVALAPQELSRTSSDYNHRLWQIREEDPSPANGKCHCESIEEMAPAWNIRDQDHVPLTTLNIDGGTLNNSPLEFARLALDELEPRDPSGHNRPDPLETTRGVVTIAPLTTPAGREIPQPPRKSLPALAGRVIEVLIAQSRLQGEDLRFTSDPKTATRWVIAPKSDGPHKEPLAGALLGAFGGFIDQRFRQHDYHLGRRNCQRFLTTYFGLPWDNVLMRPFGLSQAARERLDAVYGFPAEQSKPEDAPARMFPLIPVLPNLRTPIEVADDAIAEEELEQLGDLAVERLKRVLKITLSLGGFSGALADLAFVLFRGRVRGALVDFAANELRAQGFLK